MADGAVILKLSHYASNELTARAKDVGMSPEALATLLVEERLSDSWTWVGDDPETTETKAEDYDGPFYELDQVMDEFSAELERRLAARA